MAAAPAFLRRVLRGEGHGISRAAVSGAVPTRALPALASPLLLVDSAPPPPPDLAAATSPLLATAPPTNKATTTTAPACMARRRLMALLIMLGFFTCYTMRVNLSVAAEPMQVRG